ncbi:MAG: replication restart DNA helicase PriA [Nostoc sp. LLA-1]|nr:replication restart DNA helicase PriA [Cyanocohniella sp. LLY]
MHILQKIHCPNCGSEAERHYISDSQITRTQCASCDYLMITCTRTGRVIEAYAPGIQAYVKKQVSVSAES